MHYNARHLPIAIDQSALKTEVATDSPVAKDGFVFVLQFWNLYAVIHFTFARKSTGNIPNQKFVEHCAAGNPELMTTNALERHAPELSAYRREVSTSIMDGREHRT